jgi:adenylate cyclase class IV
MYWFAHINVFSILQRYFIWSGSLEEFEDTKGAMRIRISKKNRVHNSQIKYKRTKNDLQNIHITLKIE